MQYTRTRPLVVAILAGALALAGIAVGCHGTSEPAPFPPGPDGGTLNNGLGDGGNLPDDARPIDSFTPPIQDAPVVSHDSGF